MDAERLGQPLTWQRLTPASLWTRRWPILGLVCLAACGWGAAADGESHHYLEVTGTRQTVFSWQLKETGPIVEITARGVDEESWCCCDRTGAFAEWRLRDRERSIHAVRSGHSIRLTGTQAGKALDREVAIDAAPWFQALSYSLRCFVRSEAPSADFWIVRPDDLSVTRMQALHRGREWLDVDGVRVEACHVRITPLGLFSRLWHGDYWFRLRDGVLLRYEGTHGLPGTPRTVICLQDGAAAAADGDSGPSLQP